jgi:hypothetical protein
VLDPQIDLENRLLVPLLRDAAVLSNVSMIREDRAATMPASLYAPEPGHANAWCYYFEKADLARQMGDWEQVAELGDTAFTLDDSPNDPVERFVFIEGYAHVGDWEQAIELSKVSYRVSKDYVGPLLCRLWERIQAETTEGRRPQPVEGAERSASLDTIRNMLSCSR